MLQGSHGRLRSASLKLTDVGDIARGNGIGQLHGVGARTILSLDLQNLPTERRHGHEFLDL